MSENVVEFGGITKLDLDPDRLLQKAMGRLSEVVIIGFDKDGGEYFAASKADAGDTLYHLDRARHRLMKTIDGMQS